MNKSPNVGTWLLQSIAAIAATLHKVKLLKSLAAIPFKNIWPNINFLKYELYRNILIKSFGFPLDC